MKRLLNTLLILLTISTITFGQTKSIEKISQQIKTLGAEKQIQLEYDKSSNYSKLMLLSDGFGNDQNKKNGLSSFSFGMMYGFNGRELNDTPPVFIMTFWAKGKSEYFAQSHFWKAIVDGETVEFGEARYATKKGDNREYLNFVIPKEKLEIIARGNNVTFFIGNAEFKVSSAQLQMFTNLLNISNSSF